MSPYFKAGMYSILLGMLSMLNGCSSYKPDGGPVAPPRAIPVLQLSSSPPLSYALAVGDEIDIKVPDAPQYEQTARVRPDGIVNLNLAGAVQALGRTPEDLQRELRERYSAAAGGLQQREYLLHANDELDLKFPYVPGLNETVRIRPDGKIQLQLAGTIQAEGLTPEALQAELKRRYGKVLRIPELSVILRAASSQAVRTELGMTRAGLAGLEPTVLLRSFQSPQVYVAGEMARPGMFSFTPGLTLMQLLAQAGGHLPSGDIGNLVILRRNAEGTADVLEPRLPLRYLAAPDKDIVLQPFDLVLLPPTPIAVLGQNLDQYLFKILPPLRNSSFGFAYNINGVRP
jgi:polysaccharide export outer membrane protein